MTKHELSKLIDKEMQDVRSTILKLVGCRHFSVSTDEVTSKSMMLACLGTVIHFVDSDACEIQRAALDLSQLLNSATNTYLRELSMNVLLGFNLDISKIVRTVSDGARNMQKAFL